MRRAQVATFLLGAVLLASSVATASEADAPIVVPGPLHAEIETTLCDVPGLITIVEAPGVAWTLNGQPIAFGESGVWRLTGTQVFVGTARATALPGYEIAPGVQTTFELYRPPCTYFWEQKLQDKKDTINELRAKVRRLRDRR